MLTKTSKNHFLKSSSLLAALLFFTGCVKKSDSDLSPGSPPINDPDSLVLTFTYGSEKENWIKEVTSSFNQQKLQSASGKKIFIDAIPMGSGECVDEIVLGKRETHLVSPASEIFISLGNAESQTKLGRNLVGDTRNLVLSPVVIAMWKPMAEALGWPDKPIGWKEIHDIATNESGWASLNFPQWGPFRFGHTHPEYSNSGIISIIAETYAASNKTRTLSLEDVASPATGKYLEEIERAVVHYGRSTGFFGRKLFTNGPQYLSAAVLYENMVIESYSETGLPFPVVAIYPKEGTFFSDHPIGIVDRDYVTGEHRSAANTYIDYLTNAEQQTKAMRFGFRPADVTINLNESFSPSFGVDAKQPQTTLEVPGVSVTKAILDLWHQHKKKSNIALVLDTSGSMVDDNKMINAKLGAKQLLSMLGEQDQLSFLPFNEKANQWVTRDQMIGQQRTAIARHIDSLFASGGTALYDAINEAHQKISIASESTINAIVVLSDGEDSDSTTKLNQLLSNISTQTEKSAGVRIFTIAYGKGAKEDILKNIAEKSRGKFFKGTPQTIEETFKEISTFF